jgi:DNA replication protein DnaC
MPAGASAVHGHLTGDSGWHEIVANPTLADAILDRVIHNAYRIELVGESVRKRRMLEPST